LPGELSPAAGVTQADAGPQPHPSAAALAMYRAELNERLVVHWTGGAWRVPLAARHHGVTAADGSALGRIVCADGADAARARSGLLPVRPQPAVALAVALAPFAALLARLRTIEGFDGDRWDLAAAEGAMRGAAAAGPVVLLSAADRPVSDLIGRIAGAAAAGVIWKPAPGAAASAHLVMRALAPVIGPGVALLQGDHATGRVLATGAPVDWQGAGGAPPELIGP